MGTCDSCGREFSSRSGFYRHKETTCPNLLKFSKTTLKQSLATEEASGSQLKNEEIKVNEK